MTQNKEEQDVESYLKGESALSAAYRVDSKEQPAAHIDAAIRSAARRELKTARVYTLRAFTSKWQIPLSLAAVLVLSVSVFLTVQQEYHDNSFISPAGDQFIDTGSPVEIEADERGGRQASPSPVISVVTKNKKETRSLQKNLNIVNEKSALMRDVQTEDVAPHPPEVFQSRASNAEDKRPERYSSGSVGQRSAVARVNDKVPEPQQWLEKISQFWEQGNKEEAEKSLRAFTRVYPDFELQGYLDNNLLKVLKTEINQQ